MAEINVLLSSFNTQLDNLLPGIDTNVLAEIDLNQAIKNALIAYSKDKPNEYTEDVTGDGGKYYAITSLTKWQDETSYIISIQYPASAIADDEIPIYLEPGDWQAGFFDGTTQYLFLPNHSPASTETMRVRYTTSYQWASSSTTESISQTTHGFSVGDAILYNTTSGLWESTDDLDLLATDTVTVVTDANTFTRALLQIGIPETDFFAICHKAACLTCYQIAAKFSLTGDSTLSLDSVDHSNRAREFENRAKNYCALYSDHLALDIGNDGKTEAPPHAEFIDWDTAPGWPTNRQFIFHSGAGR